MKANPLALRLTVRILLGSTLLSSPAAGDELPTAGATPDTDARGVRAARAAQEFRIRRMARSWRGEYLEITTRSGAISSGRFLRVDGPSLLLSQDPGTVAPVLLKELYQINIKRQPRDLAFVAVLAVGVGALLGGVGALGLETEGAATGALAASGALIGATIGWKTVYQDRVIMCE